jgi:hypothetical protein
MRQATAAWRMPAEGPRASRARGLRLDNHDTGPNGLANAIDRLGRSWREAKLQRPLHLA